MRPVDTAGCDSPAMPETAALVSRLVELLQDPDIRGMAAVVLAGMGRAGLLGLMEALGHPDGKVRLVALRALREMGAVRLDVLKPLLRDPDTSVRAEAVAALGTLGAEGIPDLLNALEDPSPDVRRHAVLTAMAIRCPPEVLWAVVGLLERETDGDVLCAALNLLEANGFAEAEPAVLRCLQHPSDSVKNAALQVLSATGTQETLRVRELLMMPGTCWLAARLLGSMARFEDLRAGLSSMHESVRAASAYYLGHFGDVGHLPLLSEVLRRDPSPMVRRYAAMGLGHLGSAGVDVLLEALDDAEVRRTALVVLCDLKDPRCAPRIREFLEDPDPWVRLYAVCALGELGEPVPQEALECLLVRSETCVATALVVSRLQIVEAIQVLLRALKDDRLSPEHQRAIARALRAVSERVSQQSASGTSEECPACAESAERFGILPTRCPTCGAVR